MEVGGAKHPLSKSQVLVKSYCNTVTGDQIGTKIETKIRIKKKKIHILRIIL